MEKSDKKKYKCNECNYVTNFGVDLKRHLQTHSGVKPYQCALCDKAFTSPGNRNRHQLTHSKEKPFQCDICLVKFSEKGTLTKHQRLHTGEKLFECQQCGKKFYQKGTLRKHVLAHAKEKYLFCPTCGKGFTCNSSLKEHTQMHETLLTCKICGKRCGSTYKLNHHLKAAHEVGDIYKCKDCGEKYDTKNSFQRHRLSHKSAKPFHCSLCGSDFQRRKSLYHHMLDHGGAFYLCVSCNFAFLSKSALDEHIAAHHNQTNYRRWRKVNISSSITCPFCTKKFLNSWNLATHVKTVHASFGKDDPEESNSNLEKSIQCPVCQKKFFSQRHYLWHTICVHNRMKAPKLPVRKDASGKLSENNDKSEKESGYMLPESDFNTIYIEEESMDDEDVDSPASNMCEEDINVDPNVMGFTEIIKDFVDNIKKESNDTNNVEDFVDNIKKESNDTDNIERECNDVLDNVKKESINIDNIKKESNDVDDIKKESNDVVIIKREFNDDLG